MNATDDARRVRASAAEGLARAVLPGVFAGLGARAAELRAELGAFDSGELALDALERAADGLDRRGLAASDAGFFLGVLGGAIGIDLLVARRERDALARCARCVGAARARHLAPAPELLPQVSARAGGGWEVAFLGALLFLRAAEAEPGSSAPLGWSASFEDGRAVLALELARGAARVARELDALARATIPGAGAFAHGERSGLVLPPGWIVAPPA